MTTITMQHIRAAKLCSGGTRSWFERQGFDWSDFLNRGIDAEKFIATGDALALRVVRIAEQEKN